MNRAAWFVLTPCGTSICTNGAERSELELLRKYANAVRREDVPVEERGVLEGRLAKVRELMRTANETTATRQSAELNGLLKLYGGKIVPGADYHVLLCTDTWLGSEAAELAVAWLKAQGATVEPYRQRDLRTDDVQCFQSALAEIVEWCQYRLTAERAAGKRVIFNLTGGFKGVLTFLQALAPFYADESVYTFETGTLMRIPRLPIKISADETIQENLPTFRRLGMKLPAASGGTIPETMLFHLDGEVSLSEWGRVLWEQSREEVYRAKLLPSPSPRIVYGPKFADSTRNLSPERVAEINRKIDMLMRYLEDGEKPEHNPDSLNFKRITKNATPPSTHELYAWSDSGAKRIYIHPLPDNSYQLDRLGEHL